MFEEFKSSRNEPLSNSYVYMNIGEVENYCNNLDDFPLGLLPNGFGTPLRDGANWGHLLGDHEPRRKQSRVGN